MWLRSALLLIAVLWSAQVFGAAKYRFPEDETPEERYWKKVRAEEQQRQAAEERWQEQYREHIKSTVADIVKAGKAIQPELIVAEDGPPPSPAEPSLFKRYPDETRLACVAALVLALSMLVIVRQRRELRIRLLYGEYLSDGTAVAHYKLPDWFAPAPFPAPKPQDELFIYANQSTLDSDVRKQVAEFFKEAPARLGKIREALKEVAGVTELADRQRILSSAHKLLCEFRDKAAPWDLRPAWQMSSALELLLKRAAEKPKEATASVIGTIATAVDVLREVSVPGIRPNLLWDPPVKILAVDDDALSRHALQFALGKANLVPDLATSGEKAVELAMAHTYDVVFMDIRMPGIDGLSACSQIHQTKKNRDVPVIFVTCQSDFSTRVQSRLKGGADLMAKPFLLFELTVKAVTLTMRKRLQVAIPSRPELALPATPVLETSATETSEPPRTGADASKSEAASAIEDIPVKPGELTGHFFSKVLEYLATTRKLVDDLHLRIERGNVEDLTGALYLRIHTIATGAAHENLPIASKVSSTLEALLKRLYRNPKTVTASTLNTVSNTLKLLERLCAPGMEEKLASHPSIRILVVDDELLGRRAVVGALQLAFEQPESASDGAAASTMVAETPYDVIFTDIEMPEANGFELCANIRRSASNAGTPVAFITSHTGIEAQNQAATAGGNDFIGKPFLPVEITVKALTLAWENRLHKTISQSSPLLETKQVAETAAKQTTATVAA